MDKIVWRTAIIAGFLLAGIVTCHKEAQAGVTAGVGAVIAVYDGDVKAKAPGYQLRLGYNNVYLAGGYEKNAAPMVGQKCCGSEFWNAGVGVKADVGKVTFYLQADRYWPTNFHSHILNESLNTRLVNEHGKNSVVGRPWPAIPREEIEASWEIKSGWGARFGMGIPLGKHMEVTGTLRYLRLNENVDLKAGTCAWVGGVVSPGCNGWWQDRGTKSYKAAEVALWVRF